MKIIYESLNLLKWFFLAVVAFILEILLSHFFILSQPWFEGYRDKLVHVFAVVQILILPFITLAFLLGVLGAIFCKRGALICFVVAIIYCGIGQYWEIALWKSSHDWLKIILLLQFILIPVSISFIYTKVHKMKLKY